MTNIEIITNSKKFKTVQDLINNMDLIVDLLRYDVYRILKNTGIDGNNFDDFYSKSVFILKRNILQKQHLRGIKSLLSCTNLKVGLNKIMSKLTGETHNQYLKDRKNTVAADMVKFQNEEFEKQTNTNDIDSHLVLQDLKKLVKNDKQLVINTLNNIRLSYTLDEFEELLNKLDIDLNEFPTFEIAVQKEETNIDNTYQLKMEF